MQAILIDDEPDSTLVLQRLLERYCSDIKVVAVCHDGEDAVGLIRKVQPDIVFMDIEMPRFNGFQVLEALEDITFMLIFTTAYSQYALRAFKYSALDYLMKPIDPSELMATIARSKQHRGVDKKQISILRDEMTVERNPKKLQGKVALPNLHGYTFVELGQIVSIESEGNYAHLHMLNGQKHFIAKSLGDLEETLLHQNFFRIHRQFLINIDCITEYIRSDGGEVVLENGQRIPVSRTRREEFNLILNRL